MQCVVLLCLLVGSSVASNIGRYGSGGYLGGYGYDDQSAGFNGYDYNRDGNAYGGNVAGYSGYGEGRGGHAQEYRAARKAYGGADYGAATSYDKNNHAGTLSGYGKDNARKSFGSYDYKYKAPEYHIESYFSDENNAKQHSHDAHNEGYADRANAQQHGSGYGTDDSGYFGSAAAGYRQQGADHGHAAGYGGYGNQHGVAAAGGHEHAYDGYSNTPRYGGAVYPLYPSYFTAHTPY